MPTADDELSDLARVPDPDTIRTRLAIVLTTADVLRAPLKVSEKAARERERLRRQGIAPAEGGP